MIEYKELEGRGFRRIEVSDSVFEDRYGREDFFLEKKLYKGVKLYWSEGVLIIYLAKRGNIIVEREVKDVEEMDFYIALFHNLLSLQKIKL
jgi:hypothetical protein